MISATISWQALALQLCTDCSADCASEKIRMLDACTGRPSLSQATQDGPHGQLAASLIAISSVRCASAWSEFATVFEMRACDGVAYTPMPALPLRTDASTYMSTCPGSYSSTTA